MDACCFSVGRKYGQINRMFFTRMAASAGNPFWHAHVDDTGGRTGNGLSSGEQPHTCTGFRAAPAHRPLADDVVSAHSHRRRRNPHRRLPRPAWSPSGGMGGFVV